MATNDESKVDLIVTQLEEQIKRGEFGTNGRLPPVTQLGKEFSMSRTTVLQAINVLRGRGLVYAKGEKVTSYYVRYPIIRVTARTFDKHMAKQGARVVRNNIMDPEIVKMPVEIAQSFRIETDEQFVHRWRQVRANDITYRLSENWYPLHVAEPYLETIKQDADFNVNSARAEATGVGLARIKEEAIARMPTPEEMRLLNIPRMAPVMELWNHFIDSEGQILEYNRTVLVGAFFSLKHDRDTKAAAKAKKSNDS